MKTKNWIKAAFLNFIAFSLAVTTGCSSDSSISVLPSTDNFTQNGTSITAKMDIIWLIDNSGSMGPYQDSLQAEFDNFISEFVSNDFDFQMAVVATDAWMLSNNNLVTPNFNNVDQSGSQVNSAYSSVFGGGVCNSSTTVSSSFLNGPGNDGSTGLSIISTQNSDIDFTLTDDAQDPDSSDDVEQIFSQNIGQGTIGCGLESGLNSLRAALENPNNAGFLRPDAHLAVILVSDEEDEVITLQPTGSSSFFFDETAESMNAYLSSITNEQQGYSFHSITVLPDTIGAVDPSSSISNGRFCLDNEGNILTVKDENDNEINVNLHPAASVGSTYVALSELAGGVVASICEPFAQTLQNIATTIIEISVEFPLTATPQDPNGLIVSVRNPGETEFTAIPQDPDNGFTYNAERNSIIFHGDAIPMQGAELNILFDPTGI